ncbi:MAG TPA: DUF996 domain-containing protein [Nitrososphaerales archaeon]|nr:DUF996 domain-containing protein [Nitrososphaerales archaeon]
MATLSQVKTYGGIGSILTLLAPLPGFGWALAIAGFILMLVAVKYLSDILHDTSILNNMVLSIVAAVTGLVVGTLVVMGSVFRFMGLNGLMWSDWANLNPATIPTGDWVGLIGSVLVALAAVWVLLTVSGYFLNRGYRRVASALRINLFGTAGLLFLIGAATTIIGVGFLLIPIALILLAVAFFSINDTTPIGPAAPAV